jgi:geranylgeranyl reductase family protein
MGYDAIVVGAGPAGCAAAYDLVARGRRVLILDRRSFPRHKACAGGLTIKALRALRYSVLPVIRQVCTDLVVARQSAARRTLHGPDPICAMTVRDELDDYCLDRTREHGADFRVVPRLRAITESSASVAVETSLGAFDAPFLIAADGAHGSVRQLVPGLGTAALGFAIEGLLPLDAMPPMEFDFGAVPDGYGWVFPKGDHVNVGLCTMSAGRSIGQAELAAYAARILGGAAPSHVTGQYIGFGGWTNACATERILVVGDAAGLADPLLAEGIYNAVVSGQAAASAVDAALATGRRAAAVFAECMAPILADLRSCWRDARAFYGHLTLGYAALGFPLTRYTLMKGYACGLTYGASKRRFALLPFTRPPSLEKLLPA